MRSETRDRRRVSRSVGRPTSRPARFQVLGPLEVSGEGGALPLGGPKQRTALAHLILNANQVVAAERLIDALWGEEPPDAARGTLQAYISRLRSVLGSNAIEGRAPGYLLRVDPDEVDVLRFERLLRDAASIRLASHGRRRRRSPRRSTSGAGRRSPTWRPSRPSRPRSPGWRSSGSRPPRKRSRSDSISAGRLMSSANSRRSRVSTRCASGCGAS